MKKRVAVCLRGAVSKVKGGHIITSDHIYKDGEYVNYRAVYMSYLIHLIRPNEENYEFDFFIQSWNIDLEDDLSKLYQPKAKVFEDNRKYTKLINRNIVKSYGNTSQILSITKVLELLKKYISETKQEYDMVVVCRPDVILFKDIDLDWYDPREVYVNSNLDRTLKGALDFHFIMNQENAMKFGKIFGSKMNFVNFVEKKMKKKLLVDQIKFGIHQEVLRKIKMASIDRNNVPREIFYKYGLTDQEIDQMTHV